MKRFISILLVAVMLVAMIPAGIFTASAAEATLPTQTWIEAGKYDISWAADLITATETSGQSVTVDGNVYTCKYVNKTYEIDTVEKLVGIAVLANAGAIETFSGTTFKLTAAEYDLSAYLWTPIGYSWSQKFRGSLVSDNGTVIKGMTIVSTDTATNKCWGLIGMHGNGNIKNITLENAYIDVACGQVGSFVAYENSCGTATYENLKSDATIISKMPSTNGVYTTHGNGWVAAAGILGVHNNSAAAHVLTMKNCVFTGTIEAPSVCAVGGMVGLDRSAATVNMTGCVVASNYFRYGAYRHGGVDADWTGMGGILGLTWGGTWNIDQCYVAIDEFTVYKEQQDTNGNGGRSVGGMVGLNSNTATVKFTNCQVDMLSSGGANSHHHGTFVGEELLAVTFNNCVSTGGLARIKDQTWNASNGVRSTYTWSARALTTGGENNFCSFFQRYGWNISTSYPTIIESVDTWKNTLDSTIWSERSGSIYPILTVAKNYASHSVSGANTDYSFFNMNGTKTAMTVATVAELNALYNIYKMYGDTYGAQLMATEGDTKNYVTLSEGLKTADLSAYKEPFKAYTLEKLGLQSTRTWIEAGKYDISWAEAFKVNAESSGYTVKIGDNIYKLRGNGKTVTIDSVEKLVGIAYLANYANIETFDGCTFNLTLSEYDLSKYRWTPIGATTDQKFRGNLISENGTVIKGMTIVDNTYNIKECFGLVGQHGNGNFKNITLEGAYIEACGGNVGSFIGRSYFAGGATLTNCKSDATIIYKRVDANGAYVTNTGDGWYRNVGGIVGHNQDESGNTCNFTIDNCVFTGSIDAPSAVAVGGILGSNRNGNGAGNVVTISNCVVAAKLIRFGENRDNVDGWWGGCGGVVGVHNGTTFEVKGTYVSIKNLDIVALQGSTKAHIAVAGVIGSPITAASITDCQIDMLSNGGTTSSHHGAFVGRHVANITITGCVNTGAFLRQQGADWNNNNTYAWVAGTNTFTNGGNNFAAFKQALRHDNNGAHVYANVITSKAVWADVLDSSIWSEREGSMYPILTVAKNYAHNSVSGAGTDYSFFTYDRKMLVNTPERLNALANMAELMGTYGSNSYLMATTGNYANMVYITTALKDADMSSYSDTFKTDVAAKIIAAEGTKYSTDWVSAGLYDLSWAEHLIVSAIPEGKDTECVTFNGTIYQIKYNAKTYEIDTPEKLAGIAALANAGNIESFSGTIFKITKEINLEDFLWTPIANNTSKKFRGMITSDTEGVIKNMTIIDTANDASKCYGLVGVQGAGMVNGGVTTGTLTNLTLENASITVKNGYVGSFVGKTNHGGVDYVNLKSDAKIVCSTGIDTSTGKYIANSNAWSYVGGILGRVEDTASLNQKFINCVFTGGIDAPTASAVGGIVAGDRRADGSTLTFEKCVVAADYIRYGAERPGGYNAWYGGCAGIVGIALYADVVLTECYVSLGEYTIYAEQDTPTKPHEGTAGMVGNTDAAGTLTFTNCQMDIAVGNSDTASHLATFVGRHFAPATFTGCVNTGIVARIKGAGWSSANTFAWSARNPGITDGGNNFATFTQRYGWDVTTSTPTVITGVDTWKTALDANAWSERDGSIYPILTVAKNYTKYTVSGANVDYSFFDIAGCRVTNSKQLNALSYISKAMGETYGGASYLMDASGSNKNLVIILAKLAAADLSGYDVTFADLVRGELGITQVNLDTEGNTFNVQNSFMQVSSDGSAARFAVLMNIKNCQSVQFHVGMTYVDPETGVSKTGTFISSADITRAYKQVVHVPSGTTYTAADIGGSEDWAYVVFVVDSIPMAAANNKITFTVYATANNTDGTVTTSRANNFTTEKIVNYAATNYYSDHYDTILGFDGKSLRVRDVVINVEGDYDITMIQFTDVHFNALYTDAAHTTMLETYSDYVKYSSIETGAEGKTTVSSWNEWGKLQKADGTYVSVADTAANVERMLRFASSEEADAVFVTGDLVNFYGNANLDLVQKYIFDAAETFQLDNLKGKIVALAGNHEPIGKNYPIIDGNQGTSVGQPTSEMKEHVNTWLDKFEANYDPNHERTLNDMTYSKKLLGNKVLAIQMDNGSRYDLDDNRFTQEQVDALSADIASARANGYTILLFMHVPLHTNNSEETPLGTGVKGYGSKFEGIDSDGDGKLEYAFDGADVSQATDAAMYELITNNADVIRGIFAGHTHGASSSHIVAKTPDGKDAYIPQYVCGTTFGKTGELTRIIIK